ncbi:hypothetical protein Tco_1154397 [Tanacetum coccineum]
MALALRHASRRLRRYFEAYPITVITDQPIKQVLSKADTSGRLAQYSVKLGACNIIYEPRNAIKGKILVDFINEMPVGSEAMVLTLDSPLEQDPEDSSQQFPLGIQMMILTNVRDVSFRHVIE